MSEINVLDYTVDKTGNINCTEILSKIVKSNSTIKFPAGKYKISNWIIDTSKILNINITGEKDATVLIVEGNNIGIDISSNNPIQRNHITISDIMITTDNTEQRTKPIIYINGVNRPMLSNVTIEGKVYDNCKNFVYFDSNIMGDISQCLFRNAGLLINNNSDVKITNTWIWALGNKFGIIAQNQSNNIVLDSVDIVPPLINNVYSSICEMEETWDVEKHIAALCIDGCTNVRVSNCFIDGNSNLTTGKGIAINNSHGIKIDMLLAGATHDHIIVSKDSYAITVSNGTFSNPNYSRLGAIAIAILNSETVSARNIKIVNNNFEYEVMTKEDGVSNDVVYLSDIVNENSLTFANNDFSGVTREGKIVSFKNPIIYNRYSGLVNLSSNTCNVGKFSETINVVLNPNQTEFTQEIKDGMLMTPRRNRITYTPQYPIDGNIGIKCEKDKVTVTLNTPVTKRNILYCAVCL